MSLTGPTAFGGHVPSFDAVAIRRGLPPVEAVDTILATIRDGLDPAADHPRTSVHLGHGELLLMPSEAGEYVGLKVAAVAPENALRGLPRIRADYLLYDAATLTPVAILDGTALTALRTPAVSIAAVSSTLDRMTDPIRVVVYGTGPQAIGHADVLAAVLGDRLTSTAFISRSPARAPDIVGDRGPVLLLDSPAASVRLIEADVVVCATTSRTPLFAAAAIPAASVIIAVGSHEPDARELDPELLGAASVIVEDVATALREAGDIVLAISDGYLTAAQLIPMRDVIMGSVTTPDDRPLVFKSVGMSWQDLAIAAAIVRRAGS
jgi:ornithine cyclodeaminase